MLSDASFQELLDFHASQPILSLYVNTDLSSRQLEAVKLEVRQLLKGTAPDEAERIERYIEHEYDWSGRSLAVFSCQPADFFRAYPLAVPVASRLRSAQRPHVKPLANLLDFYGGYGVALVDKQGARLFHFHLGELREQEGVLGEPVRHVKHGEASSLHGRRGGMGGQTTPAEKVSQQNMKEAAEFAAHFFAEKAVRRVLIGGTDENTAQFRSLLPKSWQSLVMGSFPSAMTATPAEVLERAMEIAGRAEARQEQALVESLVAAAARQKGGVLELDATLKAVHDGRVQLLVLRERFRAPGYQCTGCGYTTARALAQCPFCEKPFTQIPDAVEMAVRTVLQQGGDVEVLQTPEAAEKLGNIGALLRY